MPTEILMPALSPTMEEGTLAKWHIKEGDRVSSGDVIAEIETDKATMEVEAVEEGTIGKLLIAEGTEHVPVNKPIAILLDEGEGTSAIVKVSSPSPKPAPQWGEGDADAAAHFTSPRLGEVASRSGAGEGEVPTAHSPGPSPRPSRHGEEGDRQASAEQVMHRIAEKIRRNGQERVFASPLARRLAREQGIDLAHLHGSGPRCRIVAVDIEQAAQERLPASEPEDWEDEEEADASAPQRNIVQAPQRREGRGLSDETVLALYDPGSYEIVPHNTMRRFIAERLTLAKQTIPHFYLSIDCTLDTVLAARERLNAMSPHDGPRAYKLSVNDFIIKAMAMALQTVPYANATWTERGLLLHRNSDVAVAVALEGGGLFTPVIRNAEVKSLSEISIEMRDLAARARTKRLAPHEYQGGSTTISNLGMYGIARFDAVINPPQASILAVGKAERKPVIKDDAVKIATMMSVTLSVDHRVIDGALGAQLLAAFKAYIEDPVTMLV
ncbi:MAG: pyruvate dehydrogenase complex dihydrolipoamide acetyltransferase [Methyloceanibacter sp.]|uniref:pyruvate dehydrogenase complex dihydrolipoamide acetyltransferase n=1 Tax=Methyloceanibacter sp. TaxID=1965321 RepID=UPI003D9B08D6